jgi:hypothetical protein
MTMTLLDKVNALLKNRKKINVMQIPDFAAALNTFQTKDIKELAIRGLEMAPLQFWIMPAAMRKGVHHPTEFGIGEVVWNEESKLNEVKSFGGKAFHTLRVLKFAEYFLETDDPAIKDWGGRITSMRYGNEMTARERDLIRCAVLWHDVFSGGTADEFDFKRKKMDPDHPFYHRTEFSSLSHLVSEDEWELLLLMIENHMWKWDKKEGFEIIHFHDIANQGTVREAYKFANNYRMIRIVEMSDYLASRKELP